MQDSGRSDDFDGNPVGRDRVGAWLPALLLGLAIALGGGSALFPVPRMIVELAAVPVLVVALRAFRGRPRGWSERVPLALVVLALLLFVGQLVPLPAALWMALPGRELVAETARQLGWAQRAMPISLDPAATLRAGLTLIPGIALFLAALAGDARDHRRMLIAIVAMAAASLTLGVLQALSGWSPALYLYASAHQGLPTGLFANRNHQACLLAIAPLAIAAAMPPDPRRRMAVLLGGSILALACVIGVLATGSRTGTALLLPVGIAIAVMALRSSERPNGRRLILVALVAAVVMAAIAYLGRDTMLRRFAQVEDQRFGFWPDVVAAIGTYFPVGSGFGTFEPVFAAAERLTIVGPHYLNHAHSDYLEIALEGGIAAVMLVAVYLAWLFARGAQLWRSRPTSPASIGARHAWVGLLAILLHSAVDYPLRTLALQAVFAVFTGIVARTKRRDGSRDVGP